MADIASAALAGGHYSSLLFVVVIGGLLTAAPPQVDCTYRLLLARSAHDETIAKSAFFLQNRREAQARKSNHELNVRAKIGEVEKQKRATRIAQKNRYAAGAKLSEHKFLRLLHGFATGMQMQALEPTTHTSGKTIRSTYSTLRGDLPRAAIAHPELFGQAGRVLAHEHAPKLFHAVLQSRRFKRHKQHHAPRLSCPVQTDQFVIEKIVRLLCALDLRDLPLHDDNAVGTLIEALCEAIPRLQLREPRQRLADFIPGAKAFAHDNMRLYEDLILPH